MIKIGIQESRKKALEFILDNLGQDRLWRDFKTDTHGEGVDWVTSYVATHLIDSGLNRGDLLKVANEIAERQNTDGGWGYNDKICSDVDSTSWAVIFLAHYGDQFTRNLDHAGTFLSGRQEWSGGFGTYDWYELADHLKLPEGTSLAGWSSPTCDVTATAINALTSLGRDRDAARAKKYLLERQSEPGFWRTYWWNSDVFGTVHSMLAEPPRAVMDRSWNSIRQAQAWLGAEVERVDSPFYVALALRGILKNDQFLDQLGDGVEKLLSSQSEEGSWHSSPILRFPHPSNQYPWSEEAGHYPLAGNIKWREDVADHNRVFTTATVYRTLSEV